MGPQHTANGCPDDTIIPATQSGSTEVNHPSNGDASLAPMSCVYSEPLIGTSQTLSPQISATHAAAPCVVPPMQRSSVYPYAPQEYAASIPLFRNNQGQVSFPVPAFINGRPYPVQKANDSANVSIQPQPHSSRTVPSLQQPSFIPGSHGHVQSQPNHTHGVPISPIAVQQTAMHPVPQIDTSHAQTVQATVPRAVPPSISVAAPSHPHSIRPAQPVSAPATEPSSVPPPQYQPPDTSAFQQSDTRPQQHATGLTQSQLARIQQQRRFLDNVRDPDLRRILPSLRTAVDALNQAQISAGDTYRMHLFVEKESKLFDRTGHVSFHHSAMMSLYTFFSPTFYADTEYKKSLVRYFLDIMAKFNILQRPTFPPPVGTPHFDAMHVSAPTPPSTHGHVTSPVGAKQNEVNHPGQRISNQQQQSTNPFQASDAVSADQSTAVV